MRIIYRIRIREKRPSGTLLSLKTGVILTAVLLLTQVDGKSQIAQEESLRYVIETKKTATFEVGRRGDINIVLYDRTGEKSNGNRRKLSGEGRRLTITATTLESLESAKKILSSNNAQVGSHGSGYGDNSLTLQRGQLAAQITIKHERHEKDKDVHFISHQAGRIYLFAEGDGIATGDTVVIVRDKKVAYLYPETPKSSLYKPFLMPVMWRQPGTRDLRVEISPANPKIQMEGGELVAYFRVELHSALNEDFVAAPEDIQVVLTVTGDGARGRFEPQTLVIPKDQMITPEAAALITEGGTLRIRASAPQRGAGRIGHYERDYTINPRRHTTYLSVNALRTSAIANGLDHIELTVIPSENEHVVFPEDEGLEERIIRFSLSGDACGVRFEDGNTLVIPKGRSSGTKLLRSSRAVGDVKVIAESEDGLRKTIISKGEIPIRFSFPWLELCCAMLGGALLPALLRHGLDATLQGLVLGMVFFGLALFGALSSNPQTMGPISVCLTQVPTEGPFASFLLGLVGSLLIGVAGFLRAAVPQGRRGASDNASKVDDSVLASTDHAE